MNDAQLLAELSSIRRRTRADLACGAWRWLSLWAALSFGFVLTLVVPGLHAYSGHYWLVAVPVGLAGTVAVDIFNRRADRRVRRSEWPYWATAVGITVGNTTGSLLLTPRWILVWLWVVFAVGFAVFLRLEGETLISRILFGCSGAFGLFGLLAGGGITTSITLGATFVLVLGVAAWAGYRREHL
ncbi:MAG: hypothetical protein ACLGHX_06795 [Acidimicrobiia bacterium]